MEDTLGAVVDVGVIRVILGMESAQAGEGDEKGQGSRKEKSRGGGASFMANAVVWYSKNWAGRARGFLNIF